MSDEIDSLHTGRMSEERWRELVQNDDINLTDEEFRRGWHWCPDWDGLLIGPGMDELLCCCCTWEDPEIQKRVEALREAERKLIETIFVDPLE